MQGQASALVFEENPFVSGCKAGEQGTEAVELRARAVTDHGSVSAAMFQAVLPGNDTRERSKHASKLVEGPAADHGHGAAEPVSDLIQKIRQLSSHPHQVG